MSRKLHPLPSPTIFYRDPSCLDLCILLLPRVLIVPLNHRRQQTSDRSDERTATSHGQSGPMHTACARAHACTWYLTSLARSLAHTLTVFTRPHRSLRFQPWNPVMRLDGLSRQQQRRRRRRNALSLLAFALLLPCLPCLALPCLVLPCLASPSLTSSPVLHVSFFSCSSLARLTHYRPCAQSTTCNSA